MRRKAGSIYFFVHPTYKLCRAGDSNSTSLFYWNNEPFGYYDIFRNLYFAVGHKQTVLKTTQNYCSNKTKGSNGCLTLLLSIYKKSINARIHASLLLIYVSTRAVWENWAERGCKAELWIGLFSLKCWISVGNIDMIHVYVKTVVQIAFLASYIHIPHTRSLLELCIKKSDA